MRTFQRGYDEVRFQTFTLPEGESMPEPKRWDIPVYGYLTQPIGGMVSNPGNSILKDLSISRNDDAAF